MVTRKEKEEQKRAKWKDVKRPTNKMLLSLAVGL